VTIDLASLLAGAFDKGAAVFLAVFTIVVLQKVNDMRVQEQKMRADEQKALAEERKADKEILLMALQSNTAAISSLTTMVQKYGDAVQGCELAQAARREAARL
jgi:hypothetical protein